jgi:hypothetical protein
MLKRLSDFGQDVKVVPYSGIQLLDFGFDVDALRRATRSFVERTTAEDAQGEVRTLFPLTGDETVDSRTLGPPRKGDVQYDINKTQALEPYLAKWVPIPLLRIRHERGPGGAERFDPGPTNWARVFVTPLDEREPKTGYSHRVTLAIDTTCGRAVQGQPYRMPSPEDAETEREFRFVADPAHIDWFLSQKLDGADDDAPDVQQWVDDWLDELFRELKQAQRPGKPLRDEDFPYDFEHWARYLTFLNLLDQAIAVPRICLIDTLSSDVRYQPVEVDLVLDVGNSRTCGILFESPPDQTRVDPTNSFILELRDLGRPAEVYAQPFESRVEFAQASFGKDHLSRRSGRTTAFVWPSCVRVGPEAIRLAGAAVGTETTSGMSSPKRYLWDGDPVTQDWRFHGLQIGETLPLIARSMFRFVNESGDVIGQIETDIREKRRTRTGVSMDGALRPKFSRSSLYTFMLAEIFYQAMVLINDVALRGTRQKGELLRRLRRIILTLPSATPIQEQSIMRSRAEGAIELLWDLLGWSDSPPPMLVKPQVKIDWDEASCTQLIYLYTEISRKFSGQIKGFFELSGQPRPFVDDVEAPPADGAPEPSLRLACIDIGGGTTDLMITTFYVVDNRSIRPTQNFREGFRIAGDDIVRAVIERIILPQLETALDAAGVGAARALIKELFGGNIANMQQQDAQRRVQFALHVLTPLALAMLETYETLPEGERRSLNVGDVIGWRPAAAGEPPSLAVADHLLAYLEERARDAGGRDFRLADLVLEVDGLAIGAVVRHVMQTVLGLLAEVIHHLDCDRILLSGRPSRLPAVHDMLLELLPVTPDRVDLMHRYVVGQWYPFRDVLSERIGDPKTTAAVGGMLCALVERQIANFTLQTSRLTMRSTARYIGELDESGQLFDERVIFKDIDLDKRARQAPAEATLTMHTKMHIGARQLPLERWATTPLYQLDFAANQQEPLNMPLTIKLVRKEIDEETDHEDVHARAAAIRRAEALREAFVVDEVTDSLGNQSAKLKNAVRLRLHTLGREDSYWLDTGVVDIV